jgi:hypothetical protein
MDMRQMRKVCTALVDDLHLPVPAEPAELFAALSARMSELRGRPVRHAFVAFPPQTYTGLLVLCNDDTDDDTDDIVLTDGTVLRDDVVLIEKHTSLGHQLRILFHEFYHLFAGHRGVDITQLTDDDDSARAHLGSIIAGDVAAGRVVAARSHCDGPDEADAELFSWQMAARVSHWVSQQDRIVPEHAVAVVDRLEAVLAHQRGTRKWKTSTRTTTPPQP